MGSGFRTFRTNEGGLDEAPRYPGRAGDGLVVDLVEDVRTTKHGIARFTRDDNAIRPWLEPVGSLEHPGLGTVCTRDFPSSWETPSRRCHPRCPVPTPTLGHWIGSRRAFQGRAEGLRCGKEDARLGAAGGAVDPMAGRHG